MKRIICIGMLIVSCTVTCGAGSDNPLRSVQVEAVQRIRISQMVYFPELSDNQKAAPFHSGGKPQAGYFVDIASGLNPLLSITARDPIHKLFVSAAAVTPDPVKSVPAAGFWSHLTFEDSGGRCLAEFSLSPAGGLIEFDMASGAPAVTGRSQELQQIVYALLKKHAPDSLRVWDAQGLEKQLFDENMRAKAPSEPTR